MSLKDVRKKTAEVMADDSSLMCSARGCPMRWSVDFGKGKLCTWHDITAPHSWPALTEELRSGVRPTYPEMRSAGWVVEARKHVKGPKFRMDTEPARSST